MAKSLVHYYTFDPSTNSVTVDGNIAESRLLLITNITDNETIYSFAEPTLGLVSRNFDPETERTTFVLVRDCNAMSSTDTLQIFYEKDHIEMEPSETFVDAVSKFRVSNPANLIDTDFEYGPQASKWETLQTINNIPSFYASTSDTTIPYITKVESVAGNEIITVTTQYDHNLTSGVPITVTGLSSLTAEGTYLIQSVPNSTQFTYKARTAQVETRELQGTYTSIIPGKFFQGSQINLDEAVGIVSDFYPKTVVVKLTIPLTLTTSASLISIGSVLSTDANATATVTAVSGNTITVSDITGSFTQGDTFTVTGLATTFTIATGGVGTGSNKFFINGEQTPTLSFSRKAIYVFDLSDASLSGHQFRFNTGSDGSGTDYTTYVYENGTPGTSGAYIRIYTNNQTPAQLYYYCAVVGHTGMGGSVNVVFANTSKVFLTTAAEHGFADNTNFYFVNTVSPKILEVVNPTATAPDGRPYVDIDETRLITPNVNEAETIPYNYETTYTLRFQESAVNYSSDTITIPGHKLRNGYAVLYYPNPGNTPINGLRRMQVYYVERVDDNNIKLHHSQRLNLGAINLSTGGTFTYGNHNLGLVYNIYREYKGYGDYYMYWYTYYWGFSGTYSGHDLASNSLGLGNQSWDLTACFSTNRSGDGYGGVQEFYYNYAWRFAFGTSWRTYGYHLQTIPVTSNVEWQGSFDFLTDHENYGVNGDNNGNYSYGYTVGGLNVNQRGYWTTSFYATGWNTSGYLNVYGNEYYYWYLQGYYYSAINHYFNDISADGNTNVYIALLKRNTTTNDSFYAENHLLETNDYVAISVGNGGAIHYYYDASGNRTSFTTGNYYIDKIDANRFRLKATTGSTPLRLAGATGDITISITKTNPSKNSVYIANNQFSSNELLRYETEGTQITGLTSGNTYYVKPIDGNRFQLKSTSGTTTEIDLTVNGSGIQSFENTTAEFGVVDGSYTTTRVIAENQLEVTIPFKIPPAIKSFNAATDVNSTDDIFYIPNHFFSTGTRVIYDASGNTAVDGLTNNKDYYIISVDNNYFQLALSKQDSIDGVAVPIGTTATSGFHRLISANLSGEVTGTGTVEVVSGSRRVVGTTAAFQRFFKIGDTLKVVDTTGGTPGVIVEKTITAITDDDNLLVDSEYNFSGSGLNYLIPSYIYVRPDGFFLHRPFDGGMEIGTSKSPNSRISRQTRKYFRYQSGKGIQTSYAINFTPQIPILNLSYSSTGTVQTLSGSGTGGDIVITVSDTSNLLQYMPVTGTGIPSNTRIKEIINSTQFKIDNSLTQTIAGETLTFTPVVVATVTTSKPHNLTSDLAIKVINSDTVEFNITSSVHAIPDEFNFTYLLKETPQKSVGGGFPSVAVLSWSGCDIRAGMFDDQNGFFYEFNGQTLNCVRRSSVLQIPGRISVTKNSNIVYGVNTMFTSELSKDDMIVIRGMSYRVVKVTNDTQITIQPAYRGISNSDVICTKTIDTRVPQVDWNIDKADGEGPSGYFLDLSKIQMCYMDYSWYGAGKIRFGFKDQNGHVKYVHQFKHNNRLTESYFRSGNLPARYEIENGDLPSYVGTLFHWGTSVIMDGTFQNDEAYLFTASGNVQKYTNATTQTSASNGNSVIVEQYVNWYTRRYYIRIPFASTEASKLTINTLLYHNTVASGYFLEGQPINPLTYTSGSTYFVYILYKEGTNEYFPYNYYNQIYAKIGNPSVASGTTFNIGAPAGSENRIPSDIPLISIRLAPSVDSSITGGLGEREIINRMQLQLDSVGILTTHETEISLRLNPQLSTDEYQNVENPSLCQLVRHSPQDVISGGQTILSFRASGAGNGQTSSTNFDLTKISALGNSILGGDGIYPNGPDILTVVANIVDSTGVSSTNPYSVSARITWQESQA